MAIQTVYTSKANFDRIIEGKKDKIECQKIFKIIEDYGNLVLDISPEERLDIILKNPIYKYLSKREHANVSQDSDLFKRIKDEDFSKYPKDIFLLESDKAFTSNLRDKFGCMVLNSDEFEFFNNVDIDINYAFRLPPKEKSDLASTFENWNALIGNNRPIPINSAIIIDNYLYKSPKDFDKFKVENLFSILSSIIPTTLQNEFHFTLVIDNRTCIINEARAKSIIVEVSDLIKTKIGVNCQVGIITHSIDKDIHERVILTNYHYLYSDKGFNILFGGNVSNPTKGNIQWNYHSVENYSGELKMTQHYDYLNKIRKQKNQNDKYPNIINFNVGFVDNRLL